MHDAPLLLHEAEHALSRIVQQADACLAHFPERDRLRKRVLAAQRRRRVAAVPMPTQRQVAAPA